MVSLEEVLKSSPGVDAAERLKRYLFEAWHTRRLGYLLLVGDVDVMPVRYMVLDRGTPAAFDYAFYPSDLYYADLAKPNGEFEDWNAMKAGLSRPLLRRGPGRDRTRRARSISTRSTTAPKSPSAAGPSATRKRSARSPPRRSRTRRESAKGRIPACGGPISSTSKVGSTSATR